MRGIWVVFALWLILLAGLVGFGAWHMRGVVLDVQDAPQRITAADLGDQGPGANRNVAVTGYELGPPTLHQPPNPAYAGLWFPVYPSPPAEPGSPPKVLVFVPARTPAEVEAVKRKPPAV